MRALPLCYLDLLLHVVVVIFVKIQYWNHTDNTWMLLNDLYPPQVNLVATDSFYTLFSYVPPDHDVVDSRMQLVGYYRLTSIFYIAHYFTKLWNCSFIQTLDVRMDLPSLGTIFIPEMRSSKYIRFNNSPSCKIISPFE